MSGLANDEEEMHSCLCCNQKLHQVNINENE